jgi:hypothetical protein
MNIIIFSSLFKWIIMKPRTKEGPRLMTFLSSLLSGIISKWGRNEQNSSHISKEKTEKRGTSRWYAGYARETESWESRMVGEGTWILREQSSLLPWNIVHGKLHSSDPNPWTWRLEEMACTGDNRNVKTDRILKIEVEFRCLNRGNFTHKPTDAPSL